LKNEQASCLLGRRRRRKEEEGDYVIDDFIFFPDVGNQRNLSHLSHMRMTVPVVLL
jgi:hypothetical protein